MELFAQVVEELLAAIGADQNSRGMILCYLQTSRKMVTQILSHIVVSLRARIFCSTIDSAKGLEAQHVRLLFVP